MRYRVFIALLAAGILAAADNKKLPIEQTSNESIDISATVMTDKDQIKQELGSDFGGEIVVVKVTVRNVTDKPFRVSLDDFTLISGKDGQHSQPYAPSQIAGSASLVVTEQGTRGGIGASPNGPVWGGVPGTGGGPRQLPGNGGGIGSTGTAPSSVEAKVENGKSDQDNPLLAVLKAKVMPEKEITESTSGLLYFQMLGKLKSKDLELHYKGPAGRLGLRFRP